MKVAFLPVYPNPYQRLLRDALLPNGVAVEFLDGLPTNAWLRASLGQIDILHYHWLDGLYMKRILTPVQAFKFASHLHLARELGYHMVWTAHNLLPHKTIFFPLHSAMHRLVIDKADAIIAHCDYGRRELLATFSAQQPVVVIPHGHYRDAYAMNLSRDVARERLNLTPSAFVYLALGNIAAYKGLDHLVESFNRVAGQRDCLIIAGRNRDRRLVSLLREAATRDPRIRVYPGYIEEEDMQLYLSAADVLAAPFTSILTSGSVIAALSFGVPIIAPMLGCLPELISPAAGILYQPDDPAGLDNALADIKRMNLPDMQSAARQIADGLDWDAIGRKTAAVYETCLR